MKAEMMRYLELTGASDDEEVIKLTRPNGWGYILVYQFDNSDHIWRAWFKSRSEMEQYFAEVSPFVTRLATYYRPFCDSIRVISGRIDRENELINKKISFPLDNPEI